MQFVRQLQHELLATVYLYSFMSVPRGHLERKIAFDCTGTATSISPRSERLLKETNSTLFFVHVPAGPSVRIHESVPVRTCSVLAFKGYDIQKLKLIVCSLKFEMAKQKLL